MLGRLGPRFALEAAFLILLAVGLGLADEDWVVIVAVMGGGWALVSLIELIASRRPPWMAPPPIESRASGSAPEPAAPQPPEAVAPLPTGPEPAPAPAFGRIGEETEEVVVRASPEPRAEEVVVPPSPEPRADEIEGAPEPALEAGAEPRRRRWWSLLRRPKDEIEAEPEAVEPPIEVPKHVRKLAPGEVPERAPANPSPEEER